MWQIHAQHQGDVIQYPELDILWGFVESPENKMVSYKFDYFHGILRHTCYSPTSIWIHIHWLCQTTLRFYGHKNSSLFGPTSEYVSIYTFCINIARYFQIYEHVCHNQGAVSVQKVISYQHRNTNYENKTVSRPSYLHNENPHTWQNDNELKRA